MTGIIRGHVFIDGTIECLSGLHIGGASDTIEIGGIDSPVIRNPANNEPYIPGSSFKGKMRSILERCRFKNDEFNRSGGGDTWRHECPTRDDAIKCDICRVFGSTGGEDKNKVKNPGDNHPALLIVRDCNLSEKGKSFLSKDGLPLTEAKMENALDRITAKAHPRTIERVPAGTTFAFNLIYQISDYAEKYLKKDIENLFDLLRHIEERDGLGGNISRGSGWVKFSITRFWHKDIADKNSSWNLDNISETDKYSTCLAALDKALLPQG